MPVTAGHVPGMTSGLRRVSVDAGHFRSGRWYLLAEGVLVSAFGIAGLISAALNPHAGPAGPPLLGLASAPAHSATLLALGLLAVAAVANRRAAITVTALSAVAYMALLFVSSVAATRTVPAPLGGQPAHVLLHGVLAVVNLALLMWLIPDELGDEAWVRRRRGRGHGGSSGSEAATQRAAVSPSNAPATSPQSPAAAANAQRSQVESPNAPVSVQPSRHALPEQSRTQDLDDPSADNAESSTVEDSTQEPGVGAGATNPVKSFRGIVIGVAVVGAAVAAVVVIMWMSRR
jgi:hypothetical protein